MKDTLAGARRVHIVGVGGAAMSGIATVLTEAGAAVSGSDQRWSPVLERLAAIGVRCEVGHRPGNVGDAEMVVVSRAIDPSNPELQTGLPLLSRTEALVEIASQFDEVAVVTGTHGKSSTTALLTAIAHAAGRDPSFLVGADIAGVGTNARLASPDLLIVEGDESDGTAFALGATSAIVTNVEADHMEHFGTVDHLNHEFRSFVASVSGPCAAWEGDPVLRVLKGTTLYGESAAARYRLARCLARGIDGFDIEIATPEGAIAATMSVPDPRYALNATGAAALATELDLAPGAVAAGISSYRGISRRFERRGSAAGVHVIDDYAHLPTEVAGTVAAAKALADHVVAVFQPHLFSRTALHHAALGAALAAADEIVVTDVFAARERPIDGVSGRLVADAAGPSAVYEPDRSAAVDLVAHRARPGGIVLTIGAGDVTDLGLEILTALRDRER